MTLDNETIQMLSSEEELASTRLHLVTLRKQRTSLTGGATTQQLHLVVVADNIQNRIGGYNTN